MLSLLIGEQVRGELVNCWKTGGHGRVLVDDVGRVSGVGLGAGLDAEGEHGRG